MPGLPRGDAVFALLGFLAQYFVHGTKDFGQASLRRAGELTERLNDVAKGTLTFHAWDARLAASTPLKVFNEDVWDWEEEVI